jgi:hypothetical protein
MPAMLQNQQNCMTVFSQTIRSGNTGVQPRLDSTNDTIMQPKGNTTWPRFKRQHWASYTLKNLGIYQRGSVQYISGENSQVHTKHKSKIYPVSTSREILLAWGFLSFSMQWSKRYPYGRIVSSLNMHPIIPSMSEHYALIADASVDEIQQTFYSRALHPFTRDVEGHNLFYVSRLFGICTRYF